MTHTLFRHSLTLAEHVDHVWHPVVSPPEIYDLVLLRFADGRTRSGTWNGRIWWGYDEQQQRSRSLEPTAWRKFVPASEE